MRLLLLFIFFSCYALEENRVENPIYSFNPSYQSFEPAMREDLMRWALEEISEHHRQALEEREGEKKKRIFASIVALIGALSAIVAPIVTYYMSCDT